MNVSALAGQGATNASLTPSTDDVGQSVSRMGVRVGDLHLLLPADAAREVVALPPISRIPNTASWLLGIANVRGTLVPVIDAAAAFGVARTSKEPPYLLVSGQGNAIAALLIEGLPRLLTLDGAHQSAETPPSPRLLEDSVVASYNHDHRIWIDVDLECLFDTFARHVAL